MRTRNSLLCCHIALLALACTKAPTDRPTTDASPTPATSPTEPAPQPEARVEPAAEPTPQPEPAMSPLEIELELGVDGTNIAARLVNVSKAATPVLHDPLLQPSRPILRDAEGNTIEPFDERSRAKFDNTVYRSMFVELGPGEHIVLGKAGFEHGKQGWSLAWGEFRFDELPSGSYELQIAWTSAIEQALSDADDSVVAVEGVWLGEVRSQTEALTLP